MTLIKNPIQYLAEQEEARREFLRQLTQEDSVYLMEALLLSGLTEELMFSDHHPTSLAISIQNAKKPVH